MAAHCEFGAALETEILSQFVVGVGIDEFQRECCRTNDLDLKAALEKARGYERVAENVSGLLKPTAAEISSRSINYTERRPMSSGGSSNNNRPSWSTPSHGSSRQDCGYCGRRSHKEKSECPALNTECRKCGIKGHFAKVCRGTSGSKDAMRGGQQRASMQQFRARSSGGRSQIRQLTMDMDKYEVNKQEYDEFIRYKASCDWEVGTICNRNRYNDGPRASVQMGGTAVDFLIDTGAPINVIDQWTYEAMSNKPKLERCNSRLYGYRAEEPLPILGQLMCRVRRGRAEVVAGFVVIKGGADCLLSYRTAVDLNTIKFMDEARAVSEVKVRPDLSQPIEERIKAIKSRFPDLFSGKVGCIKGRKIHIEVDPTVTPKRQPLRPIAFAWRDAVEEEIDS